jgi:hypothetical protein
VWVFNSIAASTALSAIGSANLSSITTNYSYSFVANSALTRILFTDTSAITSSVDGVLDNVSVNAAIPLPQSAGLLTIGAIGLAMARRRRPADKSMWPAPAAGTAKH